MDYLVIRTAFELMSYIKECLGDRNVSHNDFKRLILLYNLLIDFVSYSLGKEKGDVNCVNGTKK